VIARARFTEPAAATAARGHPVIIEGFYRPNATGGFEIQSVFPSANLGAGRIPVPGGTGLGGSRNVPPPVYIHPPASSVGSDCQRLLHEVAVALTLG
jgi:hypothetical protein